MNWDTYLPPEPYDHMSPWPRYKWTHARYIEDQEAIIASARSDLRFHRTSAALLGFTWGAWGFLAISVGQQVTEGRVRYGALGALGLLLMLAYFFYVAARPTAEDLRGLLRARRDLKHAKARQAVAINRWFLARQRLIGGTK
jgi:hypothetical protein